MKISVIEWSLFYLDEEFLKDLINSASLSYDRSREFYESKISKEVESQLVKVNSYYKQLLCDLSTRLESLKMNLNSRTIGYSLKSREHVNNEINYLQSFFNKISSYCEENSQGFSEVISFHDEVMGSVISPWFHRRLAEQNFYQYSITLGTLLLQFSECCSLFRSLGDVKKEAESQPQKQKQSFVRETRKYFVKREDLMQVKTEIAKHLPVYVFKAKGKRSAVTETDTSPIHSVYFENPKTFEVFANRLKKTEGAYCIRFRTYNHPKYLTNYPAEYHTLPKPKTVFIERKTHHESWVERDSVKERFELNTENVYDFMKGKYTVNDYVQHLVQTTAMAKTDIEKSVSLFQEVQSTLIRHSLVPTVTTQYDRSAFQLEGNDTVRISIDSNLTMIKEKLQTSPMWYKENMDIDYNDAYLFPYAVLEVKLQTHIGVEAPEWVNNLVSSNLVRRVEYFSKYLHGCVMHFPSEVPMLPHWSKEFAVPEPEQIIIKKKKEIKQQYLGNAVDGASENEILINVSELDRIEDGRFYQIAGKTGEEPKKELFIRVLDFLGVPVLKKGSFDKPITAPLKVEPKTFFANERTFLKWITICLFIQGAGIAFMTFADMGLAGLATGILLILVSLGFMAYSVIRYKIRAYRIQYHQAERYDDVYGPVALFVVLTLVIIINAAFNFADYFLVA